MPWRPYTWIRVCFEADEGPRFDLPMLQERMCQAVDAEPHFWEAFEDPETSKAWFWSAPDIPSLIGQIVSLSSQTF